MKRLLFIATFAFVCLFQGIWWAHMGMYDDQIWGDEAMYVETANPHEFDANKGYGHPGGPVIIGTSLAHSATHLTYKDSMYVWLTLLDAVLISLVAVLCFMLRRNLLWCAVVVAFLTVHPIYLATTPPSVVASLFAVLLALWTLYIYEGNDMRRAALAGWAVLAGLLVATRWDIGLLASGIFGLLLLPRLGITRAAGIAAAAFLVFAASDPFMWFIPVQHLSDLFFKIWYHYDVIAVGHLPPGDIIGVSLLFPFSIILALASLRKPASPLPPLFIAALLAIAGIIYSLVLTAHYQALRYLQPAIILWEVFLPMLFFWHIRNEGLPKWLIPIMAAALICYPLSHFLIYVW